MKNHYDQNKFKKKPPVESKKEPAEISELLPNGSSTKTSVYLKLTDECCLAIKNAITENWPIRMRVESKVSYFSLHILFKR